MTKTFLATLVLWCLAGCAHRLPITAPPGSHVVHDVYYVANEAWDVRFVALDGFRAEQSDSGSQGIVVRDGTRATVIVVLLNPPGRWKTARESAAYWQRASSSWPTPYAIDEVSAIKDEEGGGASFTMRGRETDGWSEQRTKCHVRRVRGVDAWIAVISVAPLTYARDAETTVDLIATTFTLDGKSER